MVWDLELAALTAIPIVVLVIALACNLVAQHWDDWLDERLGRGSIRDDWPFDLLERRRARGRRR